MTLKSKNATLLSIGLVAVAFFSVGQVSAVGGVFIASPVNGITTTSPVPIMATTNIANPQYMKIWIDGSATALAVDASSISYNAVLAPGSHRITVQAYNGALYSNVTTITVNPAPDTFPPPGAATLSGIQARSDWQTCGACGNTGATGPIASYAMTTGIASPSLSGSSAKFAINGNGHPYANGYWYVERHTGVPSAPVNYLSYSFDLYIPSSGAGNIQAIEFEAQQGAAGRTYNFAWQADYASNEWRVFNYASRAWIATAIPFSKFTPNTWHHIQALFHVGADGYGYHDGLIIDGVPYLNLNIRYAPVAAASNYLNNAFQLDTRSNGGAYSVYVDNMVLEYKG